jgi:nucleotide-binding universal stress UspA family protein
MGSLTHFCTHCQDLVTSSYETIVVSLDRTKVSERVLERATDLALACKASVLLVSVFPTHLIEEEIGQSDEEARGSRPTQNGNHWRNSYYSPVASLLRSTNRSIALANPSSSLEVVT